MIYVFIRSGRKATILTEHSSVHRIKICSTNVSGPHETQSQWFELLQYCTIVDFLFMTIVKLMANGDRIQHVFA